jgi:hypothetical protein
VVQQVSPNPVATDRDAGCGTGERAAVRPRVIGEQQQGGRCLQEEFEIVAVETGTAAGETGAADDSGEAEADTEKEATKSWSARPLQGGPGEAAERRVRPAELVAQKSPFWVVCYVR